MQHPSPAGNHHGVYEITRIELSLRAWKCSLTVRAEIPSAEANLLNDLSPDATFQDGGLPLGEKWTSASTFERPAQHRQTPWQDARLQRADCIFAD
jgi:hypothetical protein